MWLSGAYRSIAQAPRAADRHCFYMVSLQHAMQTHTATCPSRDQILHIKGSMNGATVNPWWIDEWGWRVIYMSVLCTHQRCDNSAPSRLLKNGQLTLLTCSSAGKMYAVLNYPVASEVSTRSSVVAVLANRTAYDVRYTGKLSNRFRLQVDERLVRTIRFFQVELMNAPKLNPLKRDWPKCTKSVNNRTYHDTTSARLIVFLCVLWLAKRYILVQQKCLKGQIATWLSARNTLVQLWTFSSVRRLRG